MPTRLSRVLDPDNEGDCPSELLATKMQQEVVHRHFCGFKRAWGQPFSVDNRSPEFMNPTIDILASCDNYPDTYMVWPRALRPSDKKTQPQRTISSLRSRL